MIGSKKALFFIVSMILAITQLFFLVASAASDETPILPLQEYTLTEEDPENGTAALAKVSTSKEYLLLPETLEEGQRSYGITKLCKTVFLYAPKLRGVVVPETVDTVEEGAFSTLSSQTVIYGRKGGAVEREAIAAGLTFLDWEAFLSEKLSFFATNLFLQDDLSLNFFFSKELGSLGFTNLNAEFTFMGESSRGTVYFERDEGYAFSFHNVSPHLMGEKVTAVLTAEFDGKVFSGRPVSYSVQDNCRAGLDYYKTAPEKKDYRTLVVDLLQYGTAAQNYVDHKTAEPVNGILSPEELAMGTAEKPAYRSVRHTFYTEIDDPTVTWLGANLNLSSNVTLRAYFEAASLEGICVHVTDEYGNLLETIPQSKILPTANGFAASFHGLSAAEMRKPVFFTVWQGDRAVSHTLRYSIESYAAACESDGDPELRALTDAMMRYGISVLHFLSPVDQPKTWADLASLPVAGSSMTEAELRELVVAVMYYQLSMTFTPDATYTHYINNGAHRTLYQGTVYQGLPYCTSTFGNIYRAMELIDPDTGILSASRYGARSVAGRDDVGLIYSVIGNQCSASVFWAWARVATSLTYLGSSDMVPANGCIILTGPNGELSYREELLEEGFGAVIPGTDLLYNPSYIVQVENSVRDVYAAYSQLKPGDGMIKDGHAAMVTAVNVVYNPDGKVNAGSRIWYYDQQKNRRSDYPNDYDPIVQENGVETDPMLGGYPHVKSLSFAKALEQGYLPFTIAELSDPSLVKEAKVTSDFEADEATPDQVAKIRYTSTHPISHVKVTVSDGEGVEMFSYTYFPKPTYDARYLHFYEVSLSSVGSDDSSSGILDEFGEARDGLAIPLERYCHGGYTVRVGVTVSTGQELVGFEGPLISQP